MGFGENGQTVTQSMKSETKSQQRLSDLAKHNEHIYINPAQMSSSNQIRLASLASDSLPFHKSSRPLGAIQVQIRFQKPRDPCTQPTVRPYLPNTIPYCRASIFSIPPFKLRFGISVRHSLFFSFQSLP